MAEVEYPREVAPGNVVRLKRPYHSSDGARRKAWTHGIVAQVMSAHEHWTRTNPYYRVSLHLFNPEEGTIYLHPATGIPTYVDFGADELILVKIATRVGYRDLDHDLYPTCTACDDGWAKPHDDRGRPQEVRCTRCGGLGKLFTPVPSHPEVG